MRTIDFSPLFRSAIGFDRMASMLDAATRTDQSGYPPYNIELTGEDQYRITLAVAGFKENEITITAEQNTLTIAGHQENQENRQFLYQGIANRNFERKYQLADHVRVVSARLDNGLLHVELVKELPEAMKPRQITIENASGRRLASSVHEDAA